MPGPVVKKSTRFRDMVPRPLQGLYDYVADDPMGGLTAGVIPTQAVTSLLGLHKSVPIAKKALAEFAEDREMLQAADAYGQRIAATESRHPIPPPSRRLTTPAFAKGIVTLPNRDIRRAPQVVAARKDYNAFKTRMGVAPQSRGGTSLGAEIRSEIRRGVETPRVTSMEDLALIPSRFKGTEMPKKALLQTLNIGKRGKSMARSSMPADTVKIIRQLYADGATVPEIRKRFSNLAPEVIRAVATRMSHQFIK